MKPARKPLPPALDKFIDAVKQAARDLDMHGVISVYEKDIDGVPTFLVGVRIPKSETVMTRAAKR